MCLNELVTLLCLAVLAQAPTFSVEVFDNPAAFIDVETRDGLALSKRTISGSAFSEYRVTTRSASTPLELCEAVFEWGTKGTDMPNVTLSKVLVDGPEARVVYSQVGAPIVANRDYALTVRKEPQGDGSCRIRYRATNEQAPPLPSGFVRMSKLWGEWRFVPRPDGGSEVSYTMFNDPAGSVPAFLVHGAQQKSIRETVAMALVKAKAFSNLKP